MTRKEKLKTAKLKEQSNNFKKQVVLKDFLNSNGTLEPPKDNLKIDVPKIKRD